MAPTNFGVGGHKMLTKQETEFSQERQDNSK